MRHYSEYSKDEGLVQEVSNAKIAGMYANTDELKESEREIIEEHKGLIRQIDDINYQDQYGRTALHYAAVNRHPELLNFIFQNKDLVNAYIRDKNSRAAFDYIFPDSLEEDIGRVCLDCIHPEGSQYIPTPEEVRAWRDNNIMDMLQLFIKLKKVSAYEDIHDKDKYNLFLGRLALREAKNGNKDLLKKILGEKISPDNLCFDITKPDQDGKNILHHAVMDGDISVVKEILKNTKHLDNFYRLEDKNKMRACDYALKIRSKKLSPNSTEEERAESLKIIRLFVEHNAISHTGARFAENYPNPIYQALEENDQELLTVLLKDQKTADDLVEDTTNIESRRKYNIDVMKNLSKDRAIQLVLLLAKSNLQILVPESFPPLAADGCLAREGIDANNFKKFIEVCRADKNNIFKENEQNEVFKKFVFSDSAFDATKLTQREIIVLEYLCREIVDKDVAKKPSFLPFFTKQDHSLLKLDKTTRLIVTSILQDFRGVIKDVYENQREDFQSASSSSHKVSSQGSGNDENAQNNLLSSESLSIKKWLDEKDSDEITESPSSSRAAMQPPSTTIRSPRSETSDEKDDSKRR